MNKVRITYNGETIETHNRLCKGFENWRRKMIKASILKNRNFRNSIPIDTNYDGEPFGRCLLLTEAGSTIYPIGKVLAQAKCFRAEAQSSTTGSVNEEDSYSTGTKLHLAVDFPKNGAIGTIKGIVFLNDYNGLGVCTSDPLGKTATIIPNNGSIKGEYYYFYEGKSIYKIKVSGSLSEKLKVVDLSAAPPSSSGCRLYLLDSGEYRVLANPFFQTFSATGELTANANIKNFGGKAPLSAITRKDGAIYALYEDTIKKIDASGNATEEENHTVLNTRFKFLRRFDEKVILTDHYQKEFSFYQRGKESEINLRLSDGEIYAFYEDGTMLTGSSSSSILYHADVAGIVSAIDLDIPIVKDNQHALRIEYDLNFESLF